MKVSLSLKPSSRGTQALLVFTLSVAVLNVAVGSAVPPPGGLPAGGAVGAGGTVTVPGHFGNFKEAIDKGTGGEGTVINVHPGEHRWDNFLEVGQQVDIRGTAGAILPGTLWMKKGSKGFIADMEMIKESGSAIIFEGGQWSIDACRMCCSRWAVLWCRCESEVTVKNSFLGGIEEGPGYCVNVQDHGKVHVEGCHLERSGGEYSAAVAVFHNCRLRLQGCNLQENQSALRAVTAKDVVLEVIGNTITGDLWYDTTRPGTLIEQGNTHNGMPLQDSGMMNPPETPPILR
uniref:Right handed beta helix domain-containing protein n=1 Tax=Hemiselmis andersenii TaxID=464988 RepID=A0A7S1EFU2_HEMAN|mmetsp:Transcript_48058/g.116754  ORF Transcript_48058/g.116754 Transcript_48058/m.116754 type:complete len:289 (+) Transcript_48058:38-904(+)